MDVEKHDYPLEHIPANRKLVEALYSNGKITKQARDEALNLLSPPDRWALWVSRLLLVLGSALVLSGLVYFFASNWTKITPAMKLSAIQFGMIGCLIGAYVSSLQRMRGQVLLLCASVLVGVFMAVFGQIYQTGANPYHLFMMWSLLTLGWTVIANFATQWLFWLVVTNLFLVLWWDQAALPSQEMSFLIFIYMALLNGTALALREYFAVKKNYTWLQAHWTRFLLHLATLVILLIPIIIWIFVDPSKTTKSLIISGLFGLVGHGVAYYVYRYKRPDMRSLAATLLSGCIILVAASFKIVSQMVDTVDSLLYLLMGVVTLSIFIGATLSLKRIAKKMEADHV